MMQFRPPIRAIFFLCGSALCIVPVNADETASWGTLKGRIVYGGDAPVSATLDIERDAEVCGKLGLIDESLVVSKDSRGVRYVAVWLDSRAAVPIHPDQAAPTESPTLDNLDCRFEPHMLAVRTGQTLLLKNSDPIAHNAAVYVKRSTPFNAVIPMNMPVEKTFAKPEAQPTRVDCSIHAWMKAWLIITDHPYVAITDADGHFEIRDMPSGEWKFRVWHELPGFLSDRREDSTQTPAAKGVWSLTIPSGKTLDLGDVVVRPEEFEKKK